MKILAVDPGKDGAFVIIENKNIVAVKKIKGSNEDLGRIAWEIVHTYSPDVAVLEMVFSPAGKMNKGYHTLISERGEIKGGLSTTLIRIIDVHSKSWQSAVFRKMDRKHYRAYLPLCGELPTKAKAMAVAMSVFGDSVKRYGKLHSGICDALCMALWCQAYIEGEK